MPTVTKIKLDAKDYRKELEAVVAESRAAAKSLTDLPDRQITVTADTAQVETDITSTVPSVATHASGGEYEGGWTAPFVMRVTVSGNQRPVIRQKSPVSFSWINWREVLK